MSPTRVFRVAIGLALIASCCFVSAAQAGLLIPNGNPTGVNPAVGTGGKSVLNPAPALYRIAGDCPWVIDALIVQGYNKANGWTINTQALQGDIQLDIYLPWVNEYPALKLGKYSFPATKSNGMGGAEIGLTYLPNTKAGSTDPTDARWISVIYENVPLPYEKANGQPYTNGYWATLDNGYNSKNTLNPPNNPFYEGLTGEGYAANKTTFVDIPSDTLRSNADIQFQTFVASWNPVNANDRTKGGTITLYDGVWWGFTLPAPEPSTWVMLVMGAGTIVVARWRFLRRPS